MIERTYEPFALKYSVETEEMGDRMNVFLSATSAMKDLLGRQYTLNSKVGRAMDARDHGVVPEEHDELDQLVGEMAAITKALYELAAIVAAMAAAVQFAAMTAGEDPPEPEPADVHPMPHVTQ